VGLTARAAVFHAPDRPFEVTEIDIDDPGPGDVVVRMAAVGICGTDLHSVKGEWSRPTPVVLGHEGAGVIEWVGAEVLGRAVGDEVVLSWAPGCGACSDCRAGRPARCPALNRAIAQSSLPGGKTGVSLRGGPLHRGTATGCMAERVVVSGRVALPTGGGIPLDEAALLGCAALTGVGAVLFAAKVKTGASVLVVGAGGVGQFAVQGARIAGAETIVAVDLDEARRRQALSLGATHVAHPDELDDLLGSVAPEGVGFAIDAVGDPQTTAYALARAASGSTTVIVGLPAAGRRLDLDPVDLIRKEKFLTGCLYGSADPAAALPILLEHVRAGRLELTSLLGSSYPLADVNEAVAESLAGHGGRVLLKP